MSTCQWRNCQTNAKDNVEIAKQLFTLCTKHYILAKGSKSSYVMTLDRLGIIKLERP